MSVPLYASFLTGSSAFGDSLTVRAELYGWNAFGERKTYGEYIERIAYRPWMSAPLAPLTVTMPDEKSVSVLAVRLEDGTGNVLHRNFTTFVVGGDAPASGTLATGERVRASRVSPTAVSDAKWSLKQWTIFGDAKFDGAGSGYVEYRIPWPSGVAGERRRARDVPRRGVGQASQRQGSRHHRDRRG